MYILCAVQSPNQQARCACLIRVAQLQLGPAFCHDDRFCSQVPGRQVVSVSSEAGAMMGQAERGKPFSLQDGLHQVIGSLVTLWSWQARLPGRYEMIREMYLRAGVGGDTRHAARACRWLKVGPTCLACRGQEALPEIVFPI